MARVLAQAGLPRIGPPARRSQVEPYLPFIHQTLEKFPTLTASRLYAMVCERGYRGSGDHQIILAHEIVDEKSNEIPAVQALIATLGLSGRVFTLDAMHCQKNNLVAAPPVGTETGLH